LELAS